MDSASNRYSLTFMRAQSWIRVPNNAQELALQTEDFARIEGLTAHAAAARIRRVPALNC
jgi:histidinol dehydrogenase